MSVTLQPSESLGFNRPLTQNVKCSLNITNPNVGPVSFKVKTTAPKLYCVWPNSGKVDPGQTVKVQVMLQAMKEEPPLNAKCKDKFLIQSMLIPPEKATISLYELWTTSEGEETGKVHSQKVKVNYLPPEDHRLDEEDEVPHWITLQPGNSLGFNRPLTRNVKRSLTITNPNADPVCFSIKRTAPKLYCVWPISGKVDPGQTVKVQVILLAMKEEPPLSVECKDMFLVRSMLIPPEKAAILLADLWTTGFETGNFHSQKVKVNYLPPEDQPLDVGDEFFHRITLQPSNSLGFNRPLTQNVTCSLNITNSNADPISFKVSTTAVRLYAVRPIFGKVDPGQTVEIKVMLLAMKEEPPLNAKCNDKFLIQSMLIPPEKAAIPPDDLWTTPWDGETGWVHSQGLEVDYLPAEGEEYTLIISVG